MSTHDRTPSAQRTLARRFSFCFLTLLLLLPSSLLEAQEAADGLIIGRVFNARTGRYVNNVEITIKGTSRRELTNQFGEYSIYGLEPGQYILTASYTGLSPEVASVRVSSGETIIQDFTFARRPGTEQLESEEQIFEMEEFVVDAHDFESMQELAIQEERVAVNLKHVVSAEAYGAVAQGNIGEFVKFIPGVQVDYGSQAYSSGADATAISIRGYGAEQTAVTIDGIPVANAQPGELTEAIGLDMLSINNASRVEVIKVPTPDQPSASISGTVNLISKTAFEYPKPKLSYRVYASINSENTDFFSKTPGPTNKPTYKTLPGVDLTYAWPINDKIGFTFTLATSNQFNENHRIKPTWRTRRDTEIGEWVGEDGETISPVYADASRPVLDNFSLSDNPRFSYRNSAAVKMDWRPLDGLLITTNYQFSTFNSEQGERLAEMNAAGNFALESYGPGYHIGQDGEGNHQLIVRSLDRDGETHSGYIKATYIKGPWDIRTHVSYSTSDGNLLSGENGHFSELELSMGGINKSFFYEITDGIPVDFEYYDEDGNLLNPNDLDSYRISGYDPTDPQAGTLSVRAGETRTHNEIKTAKFDIKRDLDDLIPWDWMHLAVKTGVYWEEKLKEKTGLGINYKYQFTGASGNDLNLGDFIDENYVGVDPGFGFDPYEWPDPYKVYDYFEENPEDFSNDLDIPRFNSDGDVDEISVAANNYNESVNTNLSVTEEKMSWYWQIESSFFNNRLSIVGGVRQNESSRKGRAKFTDPDWNVLRTGLDENGDGILDVIPPDPIYGQPRVDDPMFTFTAEYWANHPEWSVTYADGTPFQAGVAFDGTPLEIRPGIASLPTYFYPSTNIGVDNQGHVVSGSLAQAMLSSQANFPVNEKTSSQPSPIISGSFDVTDKIVLRLSWARSHANKNIEDTILRDVRYDTDATPPTLRVNNPTLTPWTADSYDIGLTYYTNSGGKISLSYFLKQEKNFYEDVIIPITEENFEEILPLYGISPNPIYHQDGWVIQTQQNGEGTGESTGYEVEVSQDLGILGNWGKYFYVYASYTSKSRRQPLVGNDPIGPTSDELAAGGVNFNYRRISARVNATWRSEQVSGGQQLRVLIDPTQKAGDDNYTTVAAFTETPAELKVDVNLSYRIGDRYSIDLTAKNITNTKTERFFKSVDDTYPIYAQLQEQRQFGVTYTIGFSGQF
ncbi:MAG: TonB-dependent receptor [Puniceicoccaceae bacterium]